MRTGATYLVGEPCDAMSVFFKDILYVLADMHTLWENALLAGIFTKRKDVERSSVYLQRGIAKRPQQNKQSTPTP